MIEISRPATIHTTRPIEREAPFDGALVEFEFTITAVEVLKRKPRHGTMKIRLMDDAGNAYELWVANSVVDTLGNKL